MPNITCIQWNSRGLTKARLEEFRNFLSTSTPSVVLVCETFWNNNFSFRFRSYNVINKNRADRHGGGVAILINKSIPFTSLNITNSDSIEAVGISIHTHDLGPIDIISAYCPKGDCTKEYFSRLIERDNHFLIGGDFNAHHGEWSHHSPPNRSGKSIYSALLESQHATLITPHSLGTYIHPSTNRTSTIDLMFTTADIACDASISLGPYLGSDHLPVIVTTRLSPKDPLIPPPK
jgi:exonuclease III